MTRKKRLILLAMVQLTGSSGTSTATSASNSRKKTMSRRGRRFASRFEKMNVEAHWGNWFVGSSPRAGVESNNQGIESHHKVQKTLIGKDQLRAQTEIVLATSIPAILVKAAESNSRKDLETPTYSGKGNVTGANVQEAQHLLEPGVVTFACSKSDGRTTYITNSSSNNRKDVTQARVIDYIKSLEGTVRIPKTRSEPGFKKLKQKCNCNRVILTTGAVQQNNFIDILLKVSGTVLSEPIALECNCKVFRRSSNDCAHTIAILALHCNLDLSSLQDNVVACRRVGRPATKKTSCLAKDKTKCPNHSTDEYLNTITKKHSMHFHNWRVVRTFGDSSYVGVVSRSRRLGKTSYLWGISYEHFSEGDNFEELTADELAQGLADAHEHGRPAPIPPDKNVENPLFR